MSDKMRLFPSLHSIVVILLLAPFPTDAFPISTPDHPVTITSANTTWTFNPRSTELQASTPDSTTLTISLAQALQTTQTQTLKFDCSPTTAPGGFQLTISATSPQQLSWPAVPLSDTDAQLIWPLGEGLLVNTSDPIYREAIFDREWEVGESLSLPLFGIIANGQTLSCFTTSPHRTTAHFAQPNGSTSAPLTLHMDNDFNIKSPAMQITYTFHLDQTTTDPTLPAQHYRRYLQSTGHFKTLDQKSEETTGIQLLRGAIHAYLWGDDPVSIHDIPRNKWRTFCQTLLYESETTDTASAYLKSKFTGEQWKAVAEAASAEFPYEYLKRQIAEGLSAAITDPDFPTDFPISTTLQSSAGQQLLSQGKTLTTTQSFKLNCASLSAAYPDTFLPVEQWGDGASLKMLKAFADANLDRLKLCTPGHESLQLRPQVAAEATRRDWLIGTYDSYHSVHSPDEKPDNTWSTAQMTDQLYTSGSVMKKDGTFHQGFRGVGRKTNSLAVRPYLETRVSANISEVPYNYYFVDCDATGEVYDDYDPAHPLSKEADANERNRRLQWIGKHFNTVVSSEGGNAHAAQAISVAEGIFGPFFGWDEPAMKDAKSEFFRGRYYPPNAPDVFFKPIKLKERFQKLFYNPTARIPLYATVFHDSVIATHHWNNGHYKYPEVRIDTELTELLYLAPPMYHFNPTEFEKRKADIQHYYKVWSPLHREFGFQPLTGFKYLAGNQLIQQSTFGNDCTITANFSDSSQLVGEISLPARSVLIDAAKVWPQPKIFTPSRDQTAKP